MYVKIPKSITLRVYMTPLVLLYIFQTDQVAVGIEIIAGVLEFFLKEKYGYLSRTERQQLIAQKAEVNAENWVKGYEANLGQSNVGLNPHFVDKHGPDIPLKPNLAGRAIDGTHPRTGVLGRFPQPSSQFKDWQTQRNVINEAITREARGLPKYNGFDRQGNPVVTGAYHDTVGWGFTKNRQNLSQPHFNPNYTNWTIRFDAGTGQPFTGYPTP